MCGTELHILGLLVVDAGLLRIVTVGARAPTSASSHLLTGCVQSVRMHLHKARVCSVLHLPGFSRDFDCFDSENQLDGIVVFVGF